MKVSLVTTDGVVEVRVVPTEHGDTHPRALNAAALTLAAELELLTLALGGVRETWVLYLRVTQDAGYVTLRPHPEEEPPGRAFENARIETTLRVLAERHGAKHADAN